MTDSEHVQESPLEVLSRFLRQHHPDYSIEDVVLGDPPGAVFFTKVCTHRCYYTSRLLPHLHSAWIGGVKYGYRRRNGRFESPARLWRELQDLLPRMTRAEFYQLRAKYEAEYKEASEIFDVLARG